ncbi:MAG: hypothetical protein HY819_15460 [Acidobacteria bacterium]|nr:hypothetical protein [Acidobacteriota bacterium]
MSAPAPKPTTPPINQTTDPATILRQQIANSKITRGDNSQVNNVLNNSFNLPSGDGFNNSATAVTRNNAGQIANSRVNFDRGSVTLFDNNGSFPPSSTATLPRTVFDKDGILSFYKNSNTLNDDQKNFIQNIYANDLTSRANYQANVTNLAKNLTDIAGDNSNISQTSRREINDALSSLRKAYDTLSDPKAPAPDPRALYSNVAEAYRALRNDSGAIQNKVDNGLNILSIGASNYELNRLPVGNGNATATPPATPTAAANAAGAARLAAAKGQFDTSRNQPLSDAQGKSAQVFGQQVSSFLNSVGINGVDPSKISFQVNSADQLQAIQTKLADGRQLTAIFSGGKIDATNAKVSISGTASAPSNSTSPTNSTIPTNNTTPTQDAANAARALKQQIASSKITKGDNNQVDNLLRNNFNLPSDAFVPNSTRTTRTAAGQTSNSTVTFGDNRGSVTLFNNNGSFPPSSTATLPRTVFDGRGVLSFYRDANNLTANQKQFIQNIYATDLTSRANFQANVANLAKNLTDISNDNVNLSADTRRELKDALGSLRIAFNRLSDPKAPSPDPRSLYSNVAEAYRALKNDPNAPQSKVNTGLRILSIGASNYELNRLPVGNNPTPPPTPTADANATGAKRLAAAKGQFDSLRNQLLSDAQAKPAQVFGQQVSSFLNSIGINNVDINKIAFQANSADQLQAIQTRLDDGRRLTVLFSNGKIDAANAKVAFR